ncbi:MAG: hypothetical protein ACYTFG_20660 [Planctomycetota bacterium]
MGQSPSILENLIASLIPPEEFRARGRRALSRKRRAKRSVNARLDELEEWVGELTLLNETTMRMLLTKKVFTKSELVRELKRVDLMDGVQDGMLKKKKVTKKKETKAKKKSPPKKKAAKKRARRR